MFFHNGKEPHALADAQPIDLSIQFALFWTPVLILIAWWSDKPLPLLFGVWCFSFNAPMGLHLIFV